jgi:hypothetical protein
MEFGKGSWEARQNGQFGALSYRSLMPQAIRSIAYQDLFGMSWHRQVGGGGGGGGGVVVVADVITRAIVSFERSMVNSGIGIISFFRPPEIFWLHPVMCEFSKNGARKVGTMLPGFAGAGRGEAESAAWKLSIATIIFTLSQIDPAGRTGTGYGPTTYQVRRAVYCRTRAPCAEFRRLMMPSLEGEGRPGWFSTLNASRLMRSLTLSVIGTVL